MMENVEVLFFLISCIASDLVSTFPLVILLTRKLSPMLRVLFNFKTCYLNESLYSLLTAKSLQFSLLS